MIARNGQAVVGFGDANAAPAPNTRSEKAMIAGLIGTVAGGAIGGVIGKGVGAVAGAVIGGVGAGAIAFAVTASPTEATWRRLQPTDTVKAGQQVAIAIGLSGGGPLSADQLAQINSEISTVERSYDNVTKILGQYPPGSQLPADWPSDDDLGTNAYRATIQALIDTPPASQWAFALSSIGFVAAVWVR